MIQSKKYNVMSFVLLIMRIIPLQSLYNILHTILSSLLPAAKTLAIANFIDSAGSIFEGEKEFSSIYIPILLILACIVIENVMPALLQLVNTSGRNKLNIVIKKDITRKCARLEYKHIENKDTCELVNRVCLNKKFRRWISEYSERDRIVYPYRFSFYYSYVIDFYRRYCHFGYQHSAFWPGV